MLSNIVIDTEPPKHSPVYNKIEFCADEGGFLPTSKTNYKYIFTLYIEDGTTAAPYSEKFYVPYFPDESNTQYGILDVSRTLDAYVKERYPNPGLAASTNGIYQGEDAFIVEYYVEVLSGWDVAGVFTEDPDTVGVVTSSTLYAWSGSFTHEDWIYQMNLGSPFNTWLCNITNGASAKFLTNQPQTARYSESGQLGWTYLMTDTLGDIDQYKIVTYDGLDATGSVLGTWVVGNFLTQTDPIERVMRIASAPGSLNLIPGGQFTTGAQPVVTASTKSYTIQMSNSANTVASEPLTYNIVDECRYPTHRIHFMNQLGGFDWYNFTSYSKKTTTGLRKSYDYQRHRVDGTGLLYTVSDNGKSDYIVKYRDKIKLKSDYLTDAEQTWLKELIYSPQVFLEFTDTGSSQDFHRVYVTTTNWKELINEHDKLFQLELEIEFSHQNIRQRK